MLQQIWDRMFGAEGSAPLDETAGGRRLLEPVLSVPVPLRSLAEGRLAGTLATADVFKKLVAAARTSIKIFSPYVDPTFTAVAELARAPIQVVTTLREARMKSSPVLERFSTTHPLQVRYLHEKQAQSQLFQLHAKLLLVDRCMAYVGSANFTDTSLHYNLELGLYVEDRDVIARLDAVFDTVFDFAARSGMRTG
jgi:phosphatidylserine/phosphatidylglycerophosphate/cardiolipin synthase-like enzyme